MRKKLTISVITPTRNRAALFAECLKSLCGQLTPDDEMIVIDNNSDDETPRIIKSYQKKLPLRNFRSELHGYPNLYNLAIAKSRKNILVFLDDDCIAGPHFISEIRKTHQKLNNTAVQGRVYSLPKNNLFAEISADHYLNWLQKNTLSQGRLRTVDNKNLSLPREVVLRYGGFSPAMSVGAEDTELGYRLRQHGVSIIYAPAIMVYHHERTTLASFLTQHLRIAQSHAVFDRQVGAEDRIRMINRYTWRRHGQTLFNRLKLYWRKKRHGDLVVLPLIYLLLLIVRVGGYLYGRLFGARNLET